MRAADHYRQAGMTAGLAYLDEHQTNAIAKHFMVGALVAALQAFEDEWFLDTEVHQAYALMHDHVPIAVLPTMSMARHRRRLLARALEVHRLAIKIVPVDVEV